MAISKKDQGNVFAGLAVVAALILMSRPIDIGEPSDWDWGGWGGSGWVSYGRGGYSIDPVVGDSGAVTVWKWEASYSTDEDGGERESSGTASTQSSAISAAKAWLDS